MGGDIFDFDGGFVAVVVEISLGESYKCPCWIFPLQSLGHSNSPG